MKDLTPREAVKEARKINPRIAWQAGYIKQGDSIGWSCCYIEGGHDYYADGRTLRSCLAKLKKELANN